MNPAGLRKAASLLMSLPPNAAVELLKAAKPETVTRIAAEMAYLNEAGLESSVADEGTQEFFQRIRKSAQPPRGKEYAQQFLESALGKAKSADAMRQVQDLMLARDPFMQIRNAGVKELSAALAGEAPQVAALVLAELPPQKSMQLLGLLDEKVRMQAVQGMAAGESVSLDAKLKVARMVQNRLDELNKKAAATGVVVGGDDAEQRHREQLRKVAVLLRGLEKAFRDSMVESIAQQDKATADLVLKLMVQWEDMPLMPDRVLQETMRTIDARKLALALIKADATVNQKIRSNMSERAVAMVDEEISLLSKPKTEDMTAAREVILDALRAINAKGELTFEAASA